MTERWLPIPGYEGRYDVSDLGRVRSWYPYHNTPVPRILKAHPAGGKYLAVGLHVGESQATRPIHKLVMLAFVGPRPEGLQVRHIDGDQLRNHLDNLTYGTQSENMQDRLRHGTDRNASKTHCPQNHAYDEANTRIDKHGWRGCRACDIIQDRARRRHLGVRLGRSTGDSI